jgi:hypothetical protein
MIEILTGALPLKKMVWYEVGDVVCCVHECMNRELQALVLHGPTALTSGRRLGLNRGLPEMDHA